MLSSLLFFFSAAACSQRLAVSVWWCNSVTVLLQWSRKSSAAEFGSPFLPPQTKGTQKTQQENTGGGRSGLTERETSWSQGRGSGNAKSYSWKYRTLNSCSGSGPKQIFAMWAGVRRWRGTGWEGGVDWADGEVTRFFAHIIYLSSAQLNVSISWEQSEVVRNSAPHQQPAARLEAPLSSFL